MPFSNLPAPLCPCPDRQSDFTIWNSLAVNGTSDPVGSVLAAERNLNQMTAEPLQAFLLVSVEGCSKEEAARILDVDAPTLLKLVEEAGGEVAAQLATDVLISWFSATKPSSHTRGRSPRSAEFHGAHPS
jgi:predicted DNA-binding protein (UPF0251 family)